MAKTLYLKNGKSALLLSNPDRTEARKTEFARILRDELGDDAEQEFLSIIEQVERDTENRVIEENDLLLP